MNISFGYKKNSRRPYPIAEYQIQCYTRAAAGGRCSPSIAMAWGWHTFNIDGIREYTKPLFSIPTHNFLFNAGNIDAKFYMDTLQLEESEYNLIRHPQRGCCLFKCGSERYNLVVKVPPHRAALFGEAGGK